MLEGISNLNPTLAGFKLHQDIKTWPILCQKTYIVHPLIALDNIRRYYKPRLAYKTNASVIF